MSGGIDRFPSSCNSATRRTSNCQFPAPSRVLNLIWNCDNLLGPVTHVAHAAIAVGIGSAWNSYRERQLVRLEAQKNNLLERRRAKEEAV